ncbi:conserved hypothetical protein (DUF45) [Paracholeplasma brassicae]|uniref:YgjP-like metallopeptidase domain-containing protein n=1 Tax=Acholeplasma brassicae TaxID=61635 RepID=U4KT45_9MOLU|nr:YgjP-like metallopeptidase domain-containing protein [Paracholeplasma brassicae]CCV66049.1 conserved hypothetical protein (DUF45) [Paracholeplasma brassicae]
MFKVKKDNKEIIVELKTKPNKNTYFKIKQDRLVVTKSKFIKEEVIKAYIFDNFDRIYNKISAVKDRMIKDDLANEFMLFGKTYQLNTNLTTEFSYRIEENQINLCINEGISLAKAKEMILEEMLLKEVNHIESKIRFNLQKLGVKPRPYRIKMLKSKFGSYHRYKDEITLNLYLAKLNPIYLEYVMYHEYAHVLVFNHQKAFYDVLDQWMPRHKEIQKALKKHHI